ncbi:DUF3305 domain-containing protein [Acetobacteraceae bacterium]|nr:DUF3305 domain-containing protein [Acetobacteraceae bacterium]
MKRFFTPLSATFLLIATSLSGCASIVAGTDKNITVQTDPEGAKCRLYQGGKLRNNFVTPQEINLSRSKEKIAINCVKTGYEIAGLEQKSHLNGPVWIDFAWFFAGIVPGAAAFGVDLLDGAAWTYHTPLQMTLSQLEDGQKQKSLPDFYQASFTNNTFSAPNVSLEKSTAKGK